MPMFDPFRKVIPLLLLGNLLIGLASSANAQIFADSVADFSGVQGQSNWYYGYYDRTNDANGVYNPTSDFNLMTQFNSGAWETQDGTYWDTITANAAHPNGTTTSLGRQSVEHWVVRRWVSDVATQVSLTGEFAKINTGGGNGTLGHIFVDGTEVWSQYVGAQDDIGVNYVVYANLKVGSTIDYVLDPYQSNDLYDLTKFTARVTPAPTPGALLTALMGALPGATLLLRRRRK